MYDYHHGNLPDVFKMYFIHVSLTSKTQDLPLNKIIHFLM